MADVTLVFGGTGLLSPDPVLGQVAFDPASGLPVDAGTTLYPLTGRIDIGGTGYELADALLLVGDAQDVDLDGSPEDTILISAGAAGRPDFSFSLTLQTEADVVAPEGLRPGLTLAQFPDRGAATEFVWSAGDLADAGLLDRFEVAGGVGGPLSAEEARTVAYLYEAGLDRNGAIDAEGLNFWIDAREGGLSEVGLAQAFLDSPEFEGRHGDPDLLDDRQLVELLYANVLDRPGEPAGVEFWVATAAASGLSAADLLLAFAKSPENAAGSPEVLTLAETAPGFWDFA